LQGSGDSAKRDTRWQSSVSSISLDFHRFSPIFTDFHHSESAPAPRTHQQSGGCIFLHILHINFLMTYIAYNCIFFAYFLHICIAELKSDAMHISAYLLHISCIFFAYFCIFLHISSLHIYAYTMHMSAYLMHIYAYFMHISCIYYAYYMHILCICLHILCIFVHILCIFCAYCMHIFCIFIAYLMHICAYDGIFDAYLMHICCIFVAYVLHIYCIFYAYLCIFLHIYAYVCICVQRLCIIPQARYSCHCWKSSRGLWANAERQTPIFPKIVLN